MSAVNNNREKNTKMEENDSIFHEKLKMLEARTDGIGKEEVDNDTKLQQSFKKLEEQIHATAGVIDRAMEIAASRV